MDTVISQDGTVIAFDQSGAGSPLILAGPDRAANAPLAALLSPHFTVFSYDRRGHGASGDTAPYAIEREVEDLAAVLTAVGGAAGVFGSSVNGVLALEMAARGLAGKISKLAVWEPPYIVDDTRSPVSPHYKAQLMQLLAEDRRGEMVALFFTEAVGLPAAAVAAMQTLPFWTALEGVAHTLIYDATILGDFSLPTARFAALTVPTLVIDGGGATWPWMRHGVQALLTALPNAQHQTLDGQPHNAAAAVLAPVLVQYFAG